MRGGARRAAVPGRPRMVRRAERPCHRSTASPARRVAASDRTGGRRTDGCAPVGKAPSGPLAGCHGTYRIVFRIDESGRIVSVRAVQRRHVLDVDLRSKIYHRHDGDHECRVGHRRASRSY